MIMFQGGGKLLLILYLLSMVLVISIQMVIWMKLLLLMKSLQSSVNIWIGVLLIVNQCIMQSNGSVRELILMVKPSIIEQDNI